MLQNIQNKELHFQKCLTLNCLRFGLNMPLILFCNLGYEDFKVAKRLFHAFSLRVFVQICQNVIIQKICKILPINSEHMASWISGRNTVITRKLQNRKTTLLSPDVHLMLLQKRQLLNHSFSEFTSCKLTIAVSQQLLCLLFIGLFKNIS